MKRGWGYLGASVWLPLAVASAVRGRRRGLRWRTDELALLVVLLALVGVVSALIHLTPQEYPPYNVPQL